MFRAPMLVNVIEQFIAARAANIDIDVRAIAALLVQEALEVESPVQRADARNAETIRHHGTGGGAARDRGNTAAASFLHDVVNQQKIRSELPVLDDFKFVREAREHFRAQRRVAFARTVKAELPQIGKRRFAVGTRAFGKNEFAERELQVARSEE